MKLDYRWRLRRRDLCSVSRCTFGGVIRLAYRRKTVFLDYLIINGIREIITAFRSSVYRIPRLVYSIRMQSLSIASLCPVIGAGRVIEPSFGLRLLAASARGLTLRVTHCVPYELAKKRKIQFKARRVFIFKTNSGIARVRSNSPFPSVSENYANEAKISGSHSARTTIEEFRDFQEGKNHCVLDIQS